MNWTPRLPSQVKTLCIRPESHHSSCSIFQVTVDSSIMLGYTHHDNWAKWLGKLLFVSILNMYLQEKLHPF